MSLGGLGGWFTRRTGLTSTPSAALRASLKFGSSLPRRFNDFPYRVYVSVYNDVRRLDLLAHRPHFVRRYEIIDNAESVSVKRTDAAVDYLVGGKRFGAEREGAGTAELPCEGFRVVG